MKKIKKIGVVMKYEYEAVSGDQSLFDMVGGSGGCSFVLLNKKIASLFASSLAPGLDDSVYHLIAERKVTEKYIPKAGDVFAIIDHCFDHGELLCLKSNDGGVAYEYLNDEIGHFDSIGVSAKFKFIRKHDEKTANPVNFTSEKYVPRVGDIFIVGDVEEGKQTHRCTEVKDYLLFGLEIRNIFATSNNDEICFDGKSNFTLIRRPSTK